jgi:hypothetical protein
MAAPMIAHSFALQDPTRRALHRKALAAAASVVLAFGAGGCDPRKDDTTDDVDLSDTITIEEADTADATGDGSGGSGEGSGDDGTADGGGGSSDGGTDDGGTGTTDSGTTDSGTASDAPDCTDTTGAENVECCNALFEWCADEYALDSDAYSECVYGPGFDGSTGCIPWGPPVPPAASVA